MADRYWRGGTGTWGTGTTNWSTTSGGAGGASVPTSADNVFFDSASAAANYTVTLNGTLNCLNLTIAKATAGTLTMAGTGTLNVYGNVTVVSTGVTWTGTGAMVYQSTTGVKTITTGGLTFPPQTFSGVGGTWQLQDNMTSTGSGTNVTLTAGTLDLNDKTLNTFGLAFGGSTARTLAFGTTGIINVSGSGTTIVNGGATNFTVTGTSVINLTYSGVSGTRSVVTGTANESQAINFNVTGGTDTLSMIASVRDLNFTGFAGTLSPGAKSVFGNLILSTGMTITQAAQPFQFISTSGVKTITSNGKACPTAITFNGIGGTWQLVDNFNVATGATTNYTTTLTNGTLDLNGKTFTTLLFASSNSNTRAISFGTNGVLNVTARLGTVWNCATATGFSYTGTNPRVNITAGHVSGTFGVRTISHGSAGASGNATTKAPPIYISAGTTSDTVSADLGSFSDFIYTSNRAGLINGTRTIYGNFVLAFDMPLGTGTSVTTFAGNGIQTFDSANFSIPINFPITIGNGTSNGTVVLANNTTLGNTRALTLNSGTLDANGKYLASGLFSSSGSNVRSLDIEDTTFELSGTGTVWDTFTGTNFTFASSNSTVLLSDATADSERVVQWGNTATFNNVVIGGGSAANTSTRFIYASGNTTINSLTSTKTVGHTIKISGGVNRTYTFNNWGVVGTATAPVTLTDDGAGNPHRIVYGGAGTVNVNYYTISYSYASPANTWYALLTDNNTDAGINDGWIFTGAPPTPSSTGNFFMLLMG